MNRNRNRYRNSVGLPTVAAMVLLCALVLSVALTLVIGKNRIHSIADEQRQVEREMKLLTQEISALDLRIESLLTRDKVQPRLAAAGTLLRPMTRDAIITLPPEPAPTAVAQTQSPPP